MTAAVPYTLPVISSWSLVDWVDRSWTATADATGVALATLDRLDDVTRWQLTHVVIGAATAEAAPALRLYINQVTNQSLRDGSSRGAFDVADWAMGLMVPPSSSLLARWTGLTPGDVAYINLQANVLRRS